MRSGPPGRCLAGRPVRLRRRVGLLPGLAWILVGAACATGRAPQGGASPPEREPPESGPREPGGDPEVELSPLPATEKLSRSEFRSRFWESHGVELGVQVPDPLPVLGQEMTLGLVIRNYGDRPLRLPMLRRRGLWPFRKELRGELVVDLVEDRFDLRTGRSGRSWRHVIEPNEDWLVPPFSEALFLVPIPAPDSTALDLVHMDLRATLFPLAVSFEGEPESLVAVAFPPDHATWVRAEARAGLEATTFDDLGEPLLHQPERLLAATQFLAAQDRLVVTDWLVQHLPGPDRDAAAALLLSLQAITGQPLGADVGRWQRWWSSEAGARWAMNQRLATRESQRSP